MTRASQLLFRKQQVTQRFLRSRSCVFALPTLLSLLHQHETEKVFTLSSIALFLLLLFLIPRHQRFLSHSGHANHSNLVASRSLSNHSMGRFDRMPFILKRWKGPMSIAVFVTLEEYSSFVNAITPYLGLPITFSVYIPLGLEHSSYFVRGTEKKTVFAHTLYPINLLRDLAIESIHTTHFFCVDADFFFSGLFQLRL